MGIELSSSEVCSRVQLENAFVFITTIVLQSQPISYNLLPPWRWKTAGYFSPCDNLSCSNLSSSNLSCSKPSTLSPLFFHVKSPKLLLPVFIFALFLFSTDSLWLFYGFLHISFKMQSPTLGSFKWPCSVWGMLKDSASIFVSHRLNHRPYLTCSTHFHDA